ncbi:hypothetical protein CPB83DRAFT_867467 [Crepidotus variabilis]|uniref:Uncharacterized protein n=1 Tax=Crepidotus variabilis TaxID=179855 RepID=A0A9P6JT39_9AGAR|nr:hypothetical protein CPB83DRAFT_867467 [Crepidotus variabilis]
MNSTGPQLTIQTVLNPFEIYTDSRTHGYQGPSRNVRLSRVTAAGGGGAIAKSEDGTRCAVAGKDSLRILRISPPSPTNKAEHKNVVGEGGHRIDASRNFWEASGLKIDSASTDVAWGCGLFNNKILTSARNGEVILWDINKSGSSKFERRSKDHGRSINTISVSHIVHYYCITGSADGDVRVWDLRDMSKSIMRVHHPTQVRSLVFSPSAWQPLQAVVGLDNGSIYRWDLKMGQRGQLDRLHVAHTAAVMALDWCPTGGVSTSPSSETASVAAQDASSGGLGWLVSGGLDRTVKVWDLTAPISSAHIPQKPTYVLHPSYPVRRLAWRPGYECELAIASTADYATPAESLLQHTSTGTSSGYMTRVGSTMDLSALMRVPSNLEMLKEKLAIHTLSEGKNSPLSCDAIEIWDVRRGWIGKWSVVGSGVEGGISDMAFSGSHAMWTQHTNGAFSQFDLREVTKPLDSIPRVSAAWDATGSLAFVVDKQDRWEVPYDDINPNIRSKPDIRYPRSKTLGDPQAQITTQITANYAHDFLDNDVDTFTTLARGYIFEGRERKDICAYNAGIALAAGNESAAQVWLLLGASLAEYVPDFPPTPPPSPPPYMANKAPSPKPPSFNRTNYAFPPPLSTKPSSDSHSLHRISPGRASTTGSLSRVSSGAAARRLTPTSSASSSPRHLPHSLPPITPRRGSFFGQHDSIEPSALGRAAVLRRPSLSVTPGSHGSFSHSSSPSDKNTPSHRHVGEGVLDDESSSEEEDETEAAVHSSDEESSLRTSSVDEGSGLSHRPTRPSPSPLSNIASGGSWYDAPPLHSKPLPDEEEDDDSASSPSPQSTSDNETDSEGSGPPRRPIKFRSRSNSYSSKGSKKGGASRIVKSRSRSSTLASLAAAPRRRPLTHQESYSSIKTVTAGDTSFRDPDEAIRADMEEHTSPHVQEDYSAHHRYRSTPMSEYIPSSSIRSIVHPPEYEETDTTEEEYDPPERKLEIIRAEDKRFKESTLAALKEVLEQYVEEGEVQMSAMLVLVASDELGVSRFRKTRLLDSYIDILSRLRLHTCAAYVRKFCDLTAVKKKALLGTIIYTSCGSCRKALIVPSGPSNTTEIFQGRWAYCSNCQSPAVRCSVCRLPVRAMLFQCSICHHGGHQECYRQFYMNIPMLDIPASFLPSANDLRGRQSARPPQSASTFFDDDATSTTSMQSSLLETSTQSPPQQNRVVKLKGHPCAAGCGHFCWAAGGFVDEL